MDVGSELARAREAQGMSVADLAERTRMRSAVVMAIEANDYSTFGETFARMYVRSIARVLDLDPEPLVAQIHVEPAPIDHLLEAQYGPQAEAAVERWRQPRMWFAGIGAVLVLAALAYAVLLPPTANRLDVEGTPSPAVTTPAPASDTPTAAPTGGATETPSSTAELSTKTFFIDPLGTGSSREISLVLRATAATWALVRSENGVVWKGRLEAGSTARYKVNGTASVTVNDSAAISITANGAEFTDLGDRGVRRTYTFRLS